MLEIDSVKVPKQIETILKKRMTTISLPWQYKITGQSGGGYDTAYSAHSSWEKVKAWAEKNGAEAILIRDRFKEINDEAYNRIEKKRKQNGYFPNGINKRLQRGQSNGYLLVEITDPVSRVIDGILRVQEGRL